MKISKLIKSIFTSLVLVTVFSLSLTSVFNVHADLKENIIPNTLDPMTEIGESVLTNGNFTNVNAVNRQYGLGWRLSNLEAEYGVGHERTLNPATVSREDLTETPEEMGNISTAIKVTSHGSNFALGDALTYNSLENDYNYFGGDKHIFYFSMWAKVEEETWFDITISYADTVWAEGVQKKHGEGQYFYDLGRKFKVTPEDGWTEVGKDENGNYLPFRTIGLGTDPGELTSTSYFEDSNANEATGNAYLKLPTGLNWAVIRIYAYGPDSDVAETNGLMGNGVDSGVTAETSYLLTGVKFWPSGTTFEEVIEVESVSLDVTSKELEVGESFVLTPSFNPSDAEIEISEFKSSNPSVVTVNNFGQVSAVGVGTATITYTVNNDKSATCTVTVVEAEEPVDPTPIDDGIDPLVLYGGGALGVLAIAVAAFFIVKKTKK